MMLELVRRILLRFAEPPARNDLNARVELLKAHYEAVREEEIERIKQRDQYVTHFAVAVAAISGVFLNNHAWWGLLMSVPLLAAVAGFMYAHTDITLGALSQWLRFTYTSMLKREFPLQAELEHWDGAGDQAGYVRSSTFAARYLTVAVFLGSTSAVAIEFTEPEVLKRFPGNHGWVEAALWSLALLSAAAPVLAWIKRLRLLRKPVA